MAISSRIITLSLGLLACILCSSFTAYASPQGALIRIERAEPIMLAAEIAKAFDNFIVEADHKAIISPREHDQDHRPAFSRSIGILAPEYAESFDTHGLNFVDLHRRC